MAFDGLVGNESRLAKENLGGYRRQKVKQINNTG
jgi:hypothetical protein